MTGKKILAVILSGILLLSAAGCGGSVKDTGADATLRTRGEPLSNAVERPGYVTAGKNGSRSDKKAGFQLEKPAAGEEIAVLTMEGYGEIRIRLFPDEAPLAVANFKSLIRNGYYDGLIFHRVINNFMIQGGDPTGTGSGGQSVWGVDFQDEFNANLLNLRGSLAMANSGVHTNGSQFFINQAGPDSFAGEEQMAESRVYYKQYYEDNKAYLESQYPTVEEFLEAAAPTDTEKVPDEVWELYEKYGGNIHLDGAWRHGGGHTVFGQVFEEDLAVIDKIAAVETNEETNKPLQNVIITKARIMTYEPEAGSTK